MDAAVAGRAGGFVVDAGSIVVVDAELDAGNVAFDAELDASSVAADAGVDAGSVAVDAGVDAGSVVFDASADAGSAAADAGSAVADAQADAGIDSGFTLVGAPLIFAPTAHGFSINAVAAADDANSAYGRGGGQAARVGEQEQVHELMLEHGVQIFFYGHDHVFTDIVADGIHHTLPGSAGAPWLFSDLITGYDEYWPLFGHGRVQVTPDAVNVQSVAEGGELIHQFVVE
jgi:hypothetical protein